jgi:hypothetical protein
MLRQSPDQLPGRCSGLQDAGTVDAPPGAITILKPGETSTIEACDVMDDRPATLSRCTGAAY